MIRRTVISRRNLMAGVGIGLTATRLNSRLIAAAGERGKAIDEHGHVTHHSRPDWQTTERQIIDLYDKLEIQQGCCSILPPQRPATADSFRECNQWVYDA